MPGLLRRSSSKSPSASPASSPSTSPPPTLYRRRIPIMSRSSNQSNNNTSSPSSEKAAIPASLFSQISQAKSKSNNNNNNHQDKNQDDEIEVMEQESDVECWLRMLALQREFHCYNSARLEAAVEALERGASIEEVSIPSRLCLVLLNEDLRAQMPEMCDVKV